MLKQTLLIVKNNLSINYNMKDNYELKCKSTDSDQYLNDKKGQVLISEKKDTQKSKYTFKELSSNNFFIILIMLVILIFLYALIQYLIKKYMKSIILKGGRR